jgi:hypothetical protein
LNVAKLVLGVSLVGRAGYGAAWKGSGDDGYSDARQNGLRRIGHNTDDRPGRHLRRGTGGRRDQDEHRADHAAGHAAHRFLLSTQNVTRAPRYNILGCTHVLGNP